MAHGRSSIRHNLFTESEIFSLKSSLVKKYSNKLSKKAIVGKSKLINKQEKERNKSQHSLLSHFFKGTRRNSFERKELKRIQGNSRELKGTQGILSEFI